MLNIFYYIIFLCFTIYAFIHALSYGLYEIKQEKNKIGGISIICFSALSIIFVNFIILLIK